MVVGAGRYRLIAHDYAPEIMLCFWDMPDERIESNGASSAPPEVNLPMWRRPVVSRVEVSQTLNGTNSFADGNNTSNS
jgi:hypothetical protein